MKPLKKLTLNQIERRLKKLSDVAEATKIKSGWITYLRQAMCLTLATLAKQSKMTPQALQRIEQREKSGKVTLETLRKVADAMECDLIYAIIPRTELSILLKEKARAKASKLIRNADVHMTLEDQRVTESLESRIENLAISLLEKGDIW